MQVFSYFVDLVDGDSSSSKREGRRAGHHYRPSSFDYLRECISHSEALPNSKRIARRSGTSEDNLGARDGVEKFLALTRGSMRALEAGYLDLGVKGIPEVGDHSFGEGFRVLLESIRGVEEGDRVGAGVVEN
jgi:hypothetical protein